MPTLLVKPQLTTSSPPRHFFSYDDLYSPISFPSPNTSFFLQTSPLHIFPFTSFFTTSLQVLLPFAHLLFCSSKSEMSLRAVDLQAMINSLPQWPALSVHQPYCQSAKKQAALAESSNPISIKTNQGLSNIHLHWVNVLSCLTCLGFCLRHTEACVLGNLLWRKDRGHNVTIYCVYWSQNDIR